MEIFLNFRYFRLKLFLPVNYLFFLWRFVSSLRENNAFFYEYLNVAKEQLNFRDDNRRLSYHSMITEDYHTTVIY